LFRSSLAVRAGGLREAAGSHLPTLGRGTFTAHNSLLHGQVSLGARSSVWYSASVKGTLYQFSSFPLFHRLVAGKNIRR
jgi:hypothetical protein